MIAQTLFTAADRGAEKLRQVKAIAVRKAGGDPKLSGKEFLTFRFDTVFTTK